MIATIFTSNQPRHLSLVTRLASICDRVYVVAESTTIAPGMVDDFYHKTPVMQKYFSGVLGAELKLFGELNFGLENVQTLSIKSEDLNFLRRDQLKECLDSDIYVVFGSSFIKGWLIEHLISNRALNIHMGLSPYYRGSSCNFWAMYDRNPQMVGATIHLLSAGLDSGPILYHAVPSFKEQNAFEFTMQAVVAAQESLVLKINSGEIFTDLPINQDRTQQIRYARNIDFTDEVAQDFLERSWTSDEIKNMLDNSPCIELIRPIKI